MARRKVLRKFVSWYGRDLTKYLQDGKVYYQKNMLYRFYQYPLQYAKALSKELDVPMIDYKYIEEDGKPYYLSEDYDKTIPDYKYIKNPFKLVYPELAADYIKFINNFDIDDIINCMKKLCSNFENGREVYDEYLKQTLFSFFIADPDRNHENVRLYKKGNKLKISPYFDIDYIFSINEWSSAIQLIESDLHYLSPEEMQKWCDEFNNDPDNIKEGSVYTIERINNEFDEVFNRCYDDIYTENIYSNKEHFHWDDLFQIIYNEISDKSIFDKIHNLKYEELEQKYDLEMPRNARILISNLFEVKKNEFDDFYSKNIDNKSKKKL